MISPEDSEYNSVSWRLVDITKMIDSELTKITGDLDKCKNLIVEALSIAHELEDLSSTDKLCILINTERVDSLNRRLELIDVVRVIMPLLNKNKAGQ